LIEWARFDINKDRWDESNVLLNINKETFWSLTFSFFVHEFQSYLNASSLKFSVCKLNFTNIFQESSLSLFLWKFSRIISSLLLWNFSRLISFSASLKFWIDDLQLLFFVCIIIDDHLDSLTDDLSLIDCEKMTRLIQCFSSHFDLSFASRLFISKYNERWES
jgi:hypothetical protein